MAILKSIQTNSEQSQIEWIQIISMCNLKKFKNLNSFRPQIISLYFKSWDKTHLTSAEVNQML